MMLKMTQNHLAPHRTANSSNYNNSQVKSTSTIVGGSTSKPKAFTFSCMQICNILENNKIRIIEQNITKSYFYDFGLLCLFFYLFVCLFILYVKLMDSNLCFSLGIACDSNLSLLFDEQKLHHFSKLKLTIPLIYLIIIKCFIKSY